MRVPFGRVAAAAGVLLTAGAVALASAAPAVAADRSADVKSTVATAAVPTSDVTGSFTDAAGGAGTFAGTFTPESFADEGDQVLATGLLTGTLVDSTGATVGTVEQSVTMPMADASTSGASTSAAADCQVLDLVLAPVDLDLLGLVVHLDQVHLNITAESGPGNLLGNLICAVAGLLDGGLNGLLANLLNLILGLLGSLGG